MERFDFSTGHIFIKDNLWTIFMNGSSSCGRSRSRDGIIKEILSYWKLTDNIRTEIKGLFEKKEPVLKAGEQMELF